MCGLQSAAGAQRVPGPSSLSACPASSCTSSSGDFQRVFNNFLVGKTPDRDAACFHRMRKRAGYLPLTTLLEFVVTQSLFLASWTLNTGRSGTHWSSNWT